MFKRTLTGVTDAAAPIPAGNVKNATVDLPPGFVGNPTAVPYCPSEALRQTPAQCPPETQVGTAYLVTFGLQFQTETDPVFNVAPRKGKTAEFVIPSAGNFTNIPIVADVRTDRDFSVTTLSQQIPSGYALFSTAITLWGIPWDHSHDNFRGYPLAQQQPYDASWGPIKPFLSVQTECTGSSVSTLLTVNPWEHPEVDRSYASTAPLVTGCDKVGFAPTASFDATSKSPDSSTGLDVKIAVPQNNDPPDAVALEPDSSTGAPAYWRSDAGLATSHLKRAVVVLPDGLTVNPSAAAGLEGCDDAQIGYHPSDGTFTDDDPFDSQGDECPAGSRIGSADIVTPLLKEHLAGDVVLGSPKSTDPMSGEMFRLFLVVRNEDRGLIAKIYGSAVADPLTGRLTATFDNNPRVPFSTLHLELKGGDRGILATPPTCGSKTTEAMFSPWTATGAGGGTPVATDSSFTVEGNCRREFGPTLAAGMSTAAAGRVGQFVFGFSRTDGQQWLTGLTASLPSGLLASTRGVPLCEALDAAAGSCPEGSRIGSVDAGAGSGVPFFLEKKGTAYLTVGYKGCPYGISVVVPVEAGPFRGAYGLGNIVVRQAVCVDPVDAHVTVVSDPFPTIWHGIPLRIRQVTVNVNREAFMVNPTSCTGKRVMAAFRSSEGAIATSSSAFQAVGCAALPFVPKLSMQLLDKKETHDGGHPGLEAVVTQQPGEAGIRSAKVTLPLSLALDPDNAESDALCEYADGLKVNCPPSSIIGRATAVSPLLNKPLTGNVYFVKNVRFNAKGQAIRTLPTLLIPLRGEIAVDLRATSDVEKNRLVNTFAAVPDAPISTFHLTLFGGKHGILQVTHDQDICRGNQVAYVDTDAQSGKRHDFNVSMARPCPKAKGPKFSKATANGNTVKVSVTVPAAGVVTIREKNGRLVKARKKVTKAGTVRFALKTTKSGVRSLGRHRRLTVKLAIAFKPTVGRATSASRTTILRK